VNDPLQTEIEYHRCKFTIEFTVAIVPPQTVAEAIHYLRQDLAMATLNMGGMNVSVTGGEYEQPIPSK
jgi:hypothetical protein